MPVEVKIEDLLRLELVKPDEVRGDEVDRAGTPEPQNNNRYRITNKLVSRLKKSGHITSYRESTGLFMIASRANGDCYFLDEKSRLCRVYEKRPSMCRKFPTEAGNRLNHCPMTRKS